MRPKPGEECHDYACGSAGLLVKLQLVARELDPTSKVPLRLYGQELTAESYAVAPSPILEGLTDDLVLQAMREHGFEDLSEVQSAVLEIDGTISIVPRSAKTVRTRHRVRAVRPGGN